MKSESKHKDEAVPVLVVDPTDGLSGDMFLGCLFSLGVEPEELEEELSRLPGLEPFTIRYSQVETKGIRTARVVVQSDAQPRARNLSSILDMIDSSPLPGRAKELSREVFLALGRAEARVHGMEPEKVHFHEVGCVDSIVDMVGVVLALRKLGYPTIYHRPFRLGSGRISIAHGELPVPAPATLELLRGRRIIMGDAPGEVVTPTGAVLMKVLGEELPPGKAFVPSGVVYSSGTREPAEGGGILRVITAEVPGEGREVAVIRTTIDDMNPEFYQYLSERLFDMGVHEVYYSQVIMKKSRPGVEVNILAGVNDVQDVLGVLFRETSTLGVRVSFEMREELARWKKPVRTGFGEVEVKFARLPEGEVRVSPEYESCRRIASSRGISLERVYTAARRAAMDDTDRE